MEPLTSSEVADRISRGEVNRVERVTSRSARDIVVANVFTRVNAIYFVLFLVVAFTGHWLDGLFGLLIVVNSAVGMVQEIRAKRTLDRLAILNASTVTVVRADGELALDPAEIVVDDVVEVSAGDQVPVDGDLLSTHGLEVDESLLTGESEALAPAVGAPLLSGSVVVAGTGRLRATRVGEHAYAARLAREASTYSAPSSGLRAGIDTILRYLTWVLVPVGALMVWNQLTQTSLPLDDALRGMVAALVPMVPEGLVLMTSVAMAVGVIRLGRRQCLVQDLPAMEALARVDVVCFDKTGTLTEDGMRVRELVLLDGTQDEAWAALATIGAGESRPNASMRAILEATDAVRGDDATARVPFSSARRWAAAQTPAATWVVGAPDGLLPDHPALARAAEESARGRRVLALTRSTAPLEGTALPAGLTAVALVVLDQRVRPEAAGTLRFFEEQGVTLKVISGDAPVAVAAVAEQVGLPHAHDTVDGGRLPTDPDELGRVADGAAVFGRVRPDQKRELVRALAARGRTVAMTGDGVNDVLAMKEADVGVAMGSGSPAARAVARLVLLDSSFATLPFVVAEGRRVVANIERVATLFLSKTVYSVLLALVVALTALPFPLLPRHVTLIAWFTIGIPAAVLALAPNREPARDGFVGRVLAAAVPGGVAVAVAAYGAYAVARSVIGTGSAHTVPTSTAAFLALVVVAFDILVDVARPLRPWKVALVTAMVGAMTAVVALPLGQRLFQLDPTDPRVLLVAGGGAAVGLVLRRALRVSVRAWAARRAAGAPGAPARP
ncbi:HAD-IC family P-type ATPase [Cellulomonas sp. HD19AZ1]|uniref:HAD-IC family P-type ATPase n=1 Tax=Cellulomonas sp. HD19AZ1 TaxID=2559593 RepID=UPI0010711DBA|nr:HAD-IC family P-type ATPase [Cellulomonas sp. HD19AZ1]TFH72709.1 HAD family hydrolase [Cellulomonas sp. HD19AZ1]